jgi:hypothetical protein
LSTAQAPAATGGSPDAARTDRRFRIGSSTAAHFMFDGTSRIVGGLL